MRCLLVLALLLSSAVAFADGAVFYAFRIRPTKAAKPILEADDKLAVGETKEYRFVYATKSYVAVMVAKQHDPFRPSPRYELDIYLGKVDKSTYVTNVIFDYPDDKRVMCNVAAETNVKPFEFRMVVELGMSLDGSARAACESTWKKSLADLPSP